MPTHALWRWNDILSKWQFVRDCSRSASCCSRFEKVVSMCCDPKSHPELFKSPMI